MDSEPVPEFTGTTPAGGAERSLRSTEDKHSDEWATLPDVLKIGGPGRTV